MATKKSGSDRRPIKASKPGAGVKTGKRSERPAAPALEKLPSRGRTHISVPLLAEPPTIERPKRIHPRHLLPLIREGRERNIHSTTRDARFVAAAVAAAAESADIKIALNTELSQPAINRTASNVGEPSCAVNGNVVLYTGNWYAAVSVDGGATFQYMDPSSAFADPSPVSKFCCDQVAQYVPQIDTFIWLLQYGPEDGNNIQRIAYAKTEDAAKGHWRHFDLTTQALGVPGAFLDFPDLAVGRNSLYVTTNIFGPGQRFGSAVARIPLDSLRTNNVVLDGRPFVTFDLQSLRVAQNCADTAFFAAHADTSTLAVFRWPEAQATPARTDVAVARWIGGNGYVSRTPDGRRWLDRADPRITGATLAKGQLWFAWGVDRRSNQRAQPFVQIARIDTTTLTLIENVNVFDPESATGYGALSTNLNGEVGISYMVGGGARFPSHVVGLLTGTRKDVIVASGERGPMDDQGKGEWGDYLAVRPVFPDQRMFAATGFTMKGPGDGSNRDVTPRFVTFGRVGDVTVTAPVPPPAGPPAPAPSGDDLSKPFTDVNGLPTVSAQVASTIKAACMAEGARDMPSDAEMVVPLRMVTKPGVERWPVKTGADRDIALVGKNVIDGQKLQSGIVDATVEELNRIARPADMQPITELFPKYQDRRRGPVEYTVWRIECDIISLKQEADGDYHLVLLGAGGKQMIGEVPTPRPPFVASDCPWLANIKAARKAVDDKLVAPLSPQDFVQLDNTLVPRAALTDAPAQPLAMERLPASFLTPESSDSGDMPTFAAKVKPTRARITGVGFFDKVHGQTGVAPLNGIELHPILKIEWL
jgi:hypothetical protein